MNDSMNDKTVIITGATAGIGRAAAQALARKGARVVGISRSAEKCARVADEIRRETGNADIGIFCADLSVMAEVRRAAEDLLERFSRIDVLVNNVGGIFLRREETPDGFEKTFALNHLSVFLLTRLLLDRIRNSAPARIINVSSSSHYKGKIHFEDPHLTRGYFGFKAYQQSKLANILFTHELDRRLDGSGVTVNAMHPGLVRTDIARDNGWLARIIQPLFLRNSRPPEKGAETIVHLAFEPEAAEFSGRFFVDKEVVQPGEASLDRADAARLWEVSETMLAPYL